jgi:hypothetical protein
MCKKMRKTLRSFVTQAGLLSLAAVAYSVTSPTAAQAQICLHGIGLVKNCVGPGGTTTALPGQTITCTIQAVNLDTCGDAIQIDTIEDCVHHTSGDICTGNLLAMPVVLPTLGASTTVTHTDVVQDGDGPDLVDTSEATGTDLGTGLNVSASAMAVVTILTPTPTNTPTDTPTNTPTDTPTNTPTDTPTNTPTDTPTNTPTDTPTNTPTDTPTNTPTDTPTDTPTNTPTDTPTSTQTPTDTPTNTPTDTPTATPTDTPTVCPNVTIGDYIWNDSNGNGLQDSDEAGINGVKLNIYTCTQDNVPDTFLGQVTTQTVGATDGVYTFSYQSCNASEQLLIDVDASNFQPGGALEGRQGTMAFVGGNPNSNQDSNCTNNTSDCRTIGAGQTDNTVDCGYLQCVPVTLGDFIWNDVNHNGIQDAGEPGIPNVEVQIQDCSGNTITTVTTDANGKYEYTATVCDPNTVQVNINVDTNQVALKNYQHTLVGQGSDATDSDCGKGSTASQSQCRDLTVANPTNLDTDCGFFTCDVTVDKQVCSEAMPGQGCTSGAQGITIEYTGAAETPSTLTVKAASGRTVRYDFTGSLVDGVRLTCPPQAGAPYSCVGINPALSPGNENGMTIDATASGCATCKLGTTVSVFVDGSSTAQEIFHTSCSCPDSFGDNLVVGAPMCLDANSPDNTTKTKGTPSPLWTLVALRDPSLGLISEPDPSECNQDFTMPAAPCSIEKNKLTELTFEYVGAQGQANNCANQQNSQPKDKRPCSGNADDTQPVALTVTDGGGGITFLNRPPSGAYMLGNTFTVRSVDGVKTGDGHPESKKNFPGDLRIKVFAPSNLTKTIEDQKFKSDCSKALNIGDVFGGFKVTSITSVKGGVYEQCIPVEYRYTVTDNGGGSAGLFLCDDQLSPNQLVGPFDLVPGGNLQITQPACVAQGAANTATVQTGPCPPIAQPGDAEWCAAASAQLPPPPSPTPGPCQKPVRLRLAYTGQAVGVCDGIDDVTVKVTASSGPTFTHVLDCLQPGDKLTQDNGWSLDGGTTTLATVVTVEVLDNGAPPTVCSGGNITGTNPCMTIDQCKVDGALDHEIFASTNVAITKGCVEETEQFHTSCSCSGNPDVNLVIGHQMCLDSHSGTNDSGQKGEPSHLWKLDAREPL